MGKKTKILGAPESLNFKVDIGKGILDYLASITEVNSVGSLEVYTYGDAHAIVRLENGLKIEIYGNKDNAIELYEKIDKFYKEEFIPSEIEKSSKVLFPNNLNERLSAYLDDEGKIKGETENEKIDSLEGLERELINVQKELFTLVQLNIDSASVVREYIEKVKETKEEFSESEEYKNRKNLALMQTTFELSGIEDVYLCSSCGGLILGSKQVCMICGDKLE